MGTQRTMRCSGVGSYHIFINRAEVEYNESFSQSIAGFGADPLGNIEQAILEKVRSLSPERGVT